MITLEKIVKSNLDMLNAQEAELLKSLEFVQKAITLFQSKNTGSKPHTGRYSPNNTGSKGKGKAKTAGTTTRGRKGSRIPAIISVIQGNKLPMSSREIIQTLFNRQKEVKDFNKYATLIYPALTIAYKRGILKIKNGKVHLPK